MLVHPVTFGHHQLSTGHHHGINNCYNYKYYDHGHENCDNCDHDNYDNYDNYFGEDDDRDYFDVQENMYQSGASGAVSFTRPDAVLVMMMMIDMMIIMIIMTI